MNFTFYFFIIFQIAIANANVCNMAYLKHNDTVYIHKLCISHETGEIGRAVCNRNNTSRAIFHIRKDPYYKSECDYILSGYSVSLTSINTKTMCHIDSKDFVMRCASRGRNDTKIIRILNKHGGDKLKLTASGHYVKFRQMKSQIDCNDGPADEKPGYVFSCKKSYVSKPYYGFVIMRDI